MSTNYFSGLCNSIISVLGISKGSTMSWGGAQFIAVWMIVNQVGQIVCGPLELESKSKREFMAQSCDGGIIKQTVNLFPKV